MKLNTGTNLDKLVCKPVADVAHPDSKPISTVFKVFGKDHRGRKRPVDVLSKVFIWEIIHFWLHDLVCWVKQQVRILIQGETTILNSTVGRIPKCRLLSYTKQYTPLLCNTVLFWDCRDAQQGKLLEYKTVDGIPSNC